ncbi:proteasome maturation factor UMP1 [Fistulina hepatica ATCC 64428]|uniref:Proteasome maturation factor UMP1 n=1 Tax=Fistulina hepatica ATCC 64428 TaxID=1128425 RepID=A0A0D7A4R8_9AGAR|nr:proteasome maturation factor UMP1 [Fistulina hepatica ATCC 64428]
MRIAPANAPKTASVKDTAGNFGLHDALRYGPRSLAAEVKTESGIRGRLENWEATQDNLKLTMQRNVYGLHAPMRLMMERKIAADIPRIPGMCHSNLHLDILMGRDETIGTPDIFLGNVQGPPLNDIHSEIERQTRGQ